MNLVHFCRRLFLILLISGGVVVSSSASAFSFSDIQSELQQLINKLKGSSPIVQSCVIPSAPLAFGAHSSEVKKLQVWLNENGYPVVPRGQESYYFGPLTHFALLKFQSAAGIQPVSGVYGPLTKAALEGRCSSVVASPAQLRFSASKPQPLGGDIMPRAARIEVLRFEVSGKGVLNSLALSYIGDPATIGFSQLYLYENDVRLTAGHGINQRTMTATLSDLNLAIEGVRTFSVFATAANVNDFIRGSIEITSAGAIEAQGLISGSFPIRGGEFMRSEERVNFITIARGDIVDNVVIGQRAVPVAYFTIAPDTRRDAYLRSLALTVDGIGAQEHLSNFVLKQKDQVVGFASVVNARGQVLLRFEKPVILRPETFSDFTLFADIGIGAVANTKVTIYVASPVDVDIVDEKTGKSIAVTTSRYNNSARDGSDASQFLIQGGVVTYSFKGPASSRYIVGQRDVSLVQFEIAAERQIEMRALRFALHAGGADASSTLITQGGLCRLTEANYRNIKLVDALTGEVLSRAQDTACTLGEHDVVRTLLLPGFWQVPAGKTRMIKLTADIADFTPAENESIRASLLPFVREDIRDLTFGVWVSSRDVVPGGSILGATHKIYANEVTATLTDGFVLAIPQGAAN